MANAGPRFVSVVVPTLDRPAMLREALTSVRALEGPDLAFEIIVGDNGASPETERVASEFAARYVRAENISCSAARNAAFRLATGEYVAFLDDDDIWFSTNIRPQLDLLHARPDLDAVIGQTVLADSKLRPQSEPWPLKAPGDSDDLLRALMSDLFPQMGCVVARASTRERFGLFDEKLINGQDRDWMLRIAGAGKLGVVLAQSVLLRGRPLDSLPAFDAVTRRRAGYDRRVFFRHAFQHMRLWRSPVDFTRAYSGTLDHHYWYFVEMACERAERGERKLALRAAWYAFLLQPLRASMHLVRRDSFRRSVFAALFGGKPGLSHEPAPPPLAD